LTVENNEDEERDYFSIRSAALNLLTNAYFGALASDKQLKLFNGLCLTLEYPKNNVESDQTESTASTLISHRQVSLSRKIVQRLIEDQIVPSDILSKQILQSISQSASKGEDAVGKRANLIVEAILARPEIISSKYSNLVPSLFSALKTANKIKDGSTEYTKQTILSLLTCSLESFEAPRKGQGEKEDNSEALRSVESNFNINAVIDSINATSNVTTLNKALLLICTTSKIIPQKLSGKTKDIIAPTAKSIVNNQDEFNFEVTQKVLEEVVPVLIEQSERQIIEILKYFVDEFNQIPVQRRIPVFVTLSNSISVTNFIAVIGLLLDLYVSQSVTESQDEILIFLRDLIDQYSPLEMFVPIIQLIESTSWNSLRIGNIPKNDKNKLTVLLPKNLALPQFFEKSGYTQSQRSKYEEATFRLIASYFLPSWIQNVFARFDIDKTQGDLQNKLQTIFQICVLRLPSKKDTGSEISHKRQIEVIDSLSSLLSFKNFSNGIQALLKHSNSKIRRKAMQILADRCSQKSSSFQQKQIQELLDVTLPIIKVILDSPSESLINIQTSALTLESLVRAFGHTHTASFSPIFATIISTITTRLAFSSESTTTSLNIADNDDDEDRIEGSKVNQNRAVISSCMICLASLCVSLGAANALPYLQKFFPIVMEVLKIATEKPAKDQHTMLLQISVLSTIEAIIRVLSKFLSPHLRTIIVGITTPKFLVSKLGASSTQQSLKERSAEHHMLQTDEIVKRILAILTLTVQPRLILPAIHESLKASWDSEPIVLETLVGMISSVAENMTASSTQETFKQLFPVFLDLFDFRRYIVNKKQSIVLRRVEHIEDISINAFMNILMKLSESVFKPSFLKTFDWAITPIDSSANPSIERHLFFYRLVSAISEKLKVIFVPYFAYIFDDCINILVTLPHKRTESLIAKSTTKKRKSETDSESSNDEEYDQESELLQKVLDSLFFCFASDSIGFVSKDKFDKIMSPLVNQIDQHDREISHASFAKKIDHLVPCISQLAVAVSNDNVWKPLNYQVLLKSRDSHPEVRIAVLRIIESFYDKLGENFVVLLPESVPFLAELMEDDDLGVQHLCQQVLATINSHLTGEKIEDYF
jgi:U3 small nucleolar RNA-associated protein 10